ncbi:MAG TPA: sulfotransferase, partial [Gammaproteobacteria bacterium]|nr:sulfotransferase [Gammaproteobacteria bacterium]
KGIALNFARICHHGGHCREAVHLLERIRRDMEATTGEPQDILFALGRLYDGLREYDKAFACYSRANRLKHALAGNADVLARATETYINAWSRPFDAGLPRADVRLGQVTPVFIVGMPRSGTSLVEQILASHHAVHGAGELKDIGVLIQQLNEQAGSGLSFPACLQLMGSERLNGFADAYLDKLASLGGAGCLVVTDKMPGNCWNLGLIWHLFPSARIIHCRRDPLDTCLSCFFTDFAEGHQFSYDLAELGGYYKQYRKVMRHWKEVIEVPMLENRYEDLVSNPEAATRRLVEYCGLDWDENCLAPHKTRRAVSTASFTQVREEIYTTSVGRWRHYEKYLGPLRDALDH